MVINSDVAQSLIVGTDKSATDPETLSRDTHGNDRMIGQFIEEVTLHRSYFCAVVFDIIQDYYIADEIVQGAIVRAWISLLKYRSYEYNIDNVRAWLTMVVSNAARDYVRHQNKFTLISLERNNDVLELQGSRFDRPDIVIEDIEGTTELKVLLEKLPERYRHAIILRYLEQYDYQEIAHELRSDVTLARVVVHRATKQFARAVKEARISEAALRRWLKAWESNSQNQFAEDEEIQWWMTVDPRWWKAVDTPRQQEG